MLICCDAASKVELSVWQKGNTGKDPEREGLAVEEVPGDGPGGKITVVVKKSSGHFTHRVQQRKSVSQKEILAHNGDENNPMGDRMVDDVFNARCAHIRSTTRLRARSQPHCVDGAALTAPWCAAR